MPASPITCFYPLEARWSWSRVRWPILIVVPTRPWAGVRRGMLKDKSKISRFIRLMGMYLMGIHIMGVHLMSVYLMSIHPIGAHLNTLSHQVANLTPLDVWALIRAY